MPDPVGLIGSINQNLPALEPQSAAEGPGFKNLLQEQIEKVNKLQQDATEAIEDLATGRRDDACGDWFWELLHRWHALRARSIKASKSDTICFCRACVFSAASCRPICSSALCIRRAMVNNGFSSSATAFWPPLPEIHPAGIAKQGPFVA